MRWWNRLTYKQRNVYVLFFTVILLLFGYLFAIRASIALWQNNNKIEQSLQQAANAPQIIDKLRTQAKQWNGQAQEITGSRELVQAKMLDIASKLVNKYKAQLTAMEYMGSTTEQNQPIENFRLELQGSFKALTHALHELENELASARVVSVSYSASEDRRKRQLLLKLEIVVQSIQLENYE